MTSPPSSSLTARERAVRDFVRRDRVSDLIAAVAAALIGELACGLVQYACFELPSEAGGRPIAGTAAASYCTRIDHGYRWLVFPALALLIAVVAKAAWRHRKHSRRFALLVVVVAAILNTVIMSSLPSVPGV